jgi:L-ascorbate metabolism protein UlaG (beta-lactamase superfamily)
MKITWYGHSAFRVEAGGATILIDPFLTGNPSFDATVDDVSEGVSHVLLTHGHNDHVGDTLAILEKTGAMLVANFEICMYLVGQGADDGKINPGNHGGTVVNALHSSSFGGEGGTNTYLGNPAGLVLHFPDDKTLYHMGDTDIFSDMALINELHAPQIGLVPIGDRFTMGGAVAALACQRFFKFETVIPCHYGSFPVIDQTPDKFVAGMDGSGVKVIVPQSGEAVEL